MKFLKWVIIFALVIAGLYALAAIQENEKHKCEVDLAKKFNSTAMYVNGHCVVYGYGRVN